MLPFLPGRRRFADLSEQEILALAISSEEDDARTYSDYAENLRKDYPDTAKVFESMAAQERGHDQPETGERVVEAEQHATRSRVDAVVDQAIEGVGEDGAVAVLGQVAQRGVDRGDRGFVEMEDRQLPSDGEAEEEARIAPGGQIRQAEQPSSSLVAR